MRVAEVMNDGIADKIIVAIFGLIIIVFVLGVLPGCMKYENIECNNKSATTWSWFREQGEAKFDCGGK